MPGKVTLHAQRSAKATMTVGNTGQAIFKCPDPVPARAATSPSGVYYRNIHPCAPLDTRHGEEGWSDVAYDMPQARPIEILVTLTFPGGPAGTTG
eukprot:1873374-Pleurochrysis_carterae.AAC.1